MATYSQAAWLQAASSRSLATVLHHTSTAEAGLESLMARPTRATEDIARADERQRACLGSGGCSSTASHPPHPGAAGAALNGCTPGYGAVGVRPQHARFICV